MHFCERVTTAYGDNGIFRKKGNPVKFITGFPQKAISSVSLSRFCSHSLVDPIWDRSNRIGSSAFSLYEFKRLERTPRIRAATAPSLALF